VLPAVIRSPSKSARGPRAADHHLESPVSVDIAELNA
jgi:hypothetical protein